jgi:hypothetical protein
VLRDGAQPLVQEELEGVVVCADSERLRPKIWTPVKNRLKQPNKLSLVCCKLGVARCDGPAVEHNGTAILVQDCAEAGAGGVTVDDESAVEVR